MKRRSAWVLCAIAGIGTAEAGHPRYDRDGGYYAWADVVDVEPIVRIVEVAEPEERCWREPVRRASHDGRYRSHTPALLGGIIGGVIGHQFGSGRGNDVMTVAGTLLGASVGRDAAHARHARPAYTTERVCEIGERVREEEQLEGYRVRYRLDGHEFVTRTDSHPGERLRVRVEVEPAYN